MKLDQSKALELEKIVGVESQIKALYTLLKIKKYNISNTVIPTFTDHKKFVLNHPYRVWYLVKRHHKYIGAVYILKNNAIGISVEDKKKSAIKDVINIIIKKHKPLKEIKSVRPPCFYINSSPKNITLMSTLTTMGFKEIQRTYLLGE
ncbi:hypothetical protein FD975_01645 [Polynucleobacter sp. AP-Jannik-300A-C4]|uniref:hypothetical protein n=1 Tax=Polynucleobacter sp. AP-Jannik-300A-C4 TaxID=2576928 RepID=UPI001BFE03B7|nr:hypothetical protein [Polynucleobacter sp. AP-Jannik-300A-C4]QWE22938.1 hypothetical protein FD975_01645 [Polynucleobacter sp. AP-Jannik-300A-C4]